MDIITFIVLFLIILSSLIFVLQLVSFDFAGLCVVIKLDCEITQSATVRV